MKIYQIEVSNYCNMSCSYCPHHTQKRQKGNMSMETFQKVVNLAAALDQRMLFLHNFGEPILNPLIFDFIQFAGTKGIECSFYSNGSLLTRNILRELFHAGLKRICISDHIKDMHNHIRDILVCEGIPIRIESHFDISSIHDWAGQVTTEEKEIFTSEIPNACIFERQNAFVVLWNGDITTCCIDCEGISVSMNLDELIATKSYKFSKFSLCNQCGLMRGEEVL